MKIGIIDYGSGNLHSVHHSVEHAASQLKPKIEIERISTSDAISSCDHIILPGVGHYADCRAGLVDIDGMMEALTEAVQRRAVPFLGICVGMQLLADEGHEGGVITPGLGWIGGRVRHFEDCLEEPSHTALKIPHTGWNHLQITKSDHPVCSRLAEGIQMYFVHSYLFEPSDSEDIVATTQYGAVFPVMVGRDNIIATQFHPEKSQRAGQAFLQAYLSWAP